MQARPYRPDIGRFLVQDRFESASGDFALQSDPMMSNRYTFASANPVNNIEFDGHEPITTYNPRGRQKMSDKSGRCFRDCDGDDFNGSVSPPPTSGRNTYAQWEGRQTPSGQHLFRRSARPNVAPPPAGALRSAAQPSSCPGCVDKETDVNPFEGLNNLVHGATILAEWYVGNPRESWLDRLGLMPGLGVAGKGVKGGKAAIGLFRGSDEAASPGKVVLGRNMAERVIPHTRRVGGEYYAGTPRGLRWLPQQAEVWLNRWWLRRKIRKGYEIEDIGPDPRNSRRSPFYEGEHETLRRHGYPNYRRADPASGQ